jgi:predicted aspartyl protease
LAKWVSVEHCTQGTPLLLPSHRPQLLVISPVAALGLVRQSGSQAVLADGSVRQFDLYAADVSWNGVWRSVLVSAVGNEPLLGMRLLARHALRIDIVPGGTVEIAPLDR